MKKEIGLSEDGEITFKRIGNTLRMLMIHQRQIYGLFSPQRKPRPRKETTMVIEFFFLAYCPNVVDRDCGSQKGDRRFFFLYMFFIYLFNIKVKTL